MKNVAIIIRGPSGVGKSTVSRELHNLIEKSAHINVDTLKKMISSESSTERTEIAHSTAQFFIKELILNKFNVIIEEIFRDQHLSEIKKVIQSSGYVCFTFFLAAPAKTLLQRDEGRKEKTKGEQIILNLYKEIQPNPNEEIINTEKLTEKEIANKIIDTVYKKSPKK